MKARFQVKAGDLRPLDGGESEIEGKGGDSGPLDLKSSTSYVALIMKLESQSGERKRKHMQRQLGRAEIISVAFVNMLRIHPALPERKFPDVEWLDGSLYDSVGVRLK